MAFEYDPKTSLRHWPAPMGKYGKTPFGDNLYRIVFRASRRHLVGGTWPDGSTGYHWVEKYRTVAAQWILERWYSAQEYTRMSMSEYNRTMVEPISGWLINGPYPSRGEYDMVWEFDYGVSADSLDNIIGAIERGRDRSFTDLQQFNKSEYEAEDRATRSACDAEIRDAVTAFGNAPISAGRWGRGSKTAPDLRYSAEDLGLPVPRRMGPNPRDLRGLAVSNTLAVR